MQFYSVTISVLCAWNCIQQAWDVVHLVETCRWYNINKENRVCAKFSENLIGDEFHYLFICSNPEIVNLSFRNIPNYYFRNSNVEKWLVCLSLCHIELLKNLSLFLKGLNRLFSSMSSLSPVFFFLFPI